MYGSRSLSKIKWEGSLCDSGLCTFIRHLPSAHDVIGPVLGTGVLSAQRWEGA